jgi:hypothetical protein
MAESEKSHSLFSMAEQSSASEPKFWLHVPLQTAHSEYLTPPAD